MTNEEKQLQVMPWEVQVGYWEKKSSLKECLNIDPGCPGLLRSLPFLEVFKTQAEVALGDEVQWVQGDLVEGWIGCLGILSQPFYDDSVLL